MFGVELENLQHVGEDRVAHDLLVLALVPVDRLFLLLDLDQAVEKAFREPSLVPLLAVTTFELGAQHFAQILQDLGDDAIGVEVLLQPLHGSTLQKPAAAARRQRVARYSALVQAVAS